MEVLKEWDVKLKLVKTKTGALLYVIDFGDGFFIEQNPLKDSKYGHAYRKLKGMYEETYMFWEIRKNHYTGRMLLGFFLKKHQIDPLITLLAKSEEFMSFEDVKDEAEKEEVNEHLQKSRE